MFVIFIEKRTTVVDINLDSPATPKTSSIPLHRHRAQGSSSGRISEVGAVGDPRTPRLVIFNADDLDQESFGNVMNLIERQEEDSALLGFLLLSSSHAFWSSSMDLEGIVS